QTPHLIDQRGAPLNEATAHPVDGLDILALHSLERHEAHLGPGHRCTDRLGLTALSLIPSDIRCDELGTHELGGVPPLLKPPGPIRRTRTRLHPNPTRGQLRARLEQLAAGHPLVDGDFAVFIYPVELENIFGHINPACRSFQGRSSLSLYNAAIL